MTKTCLTCGKEFETSSTKKRYCSLVCQHAPMDKKKIDAKYCKQCGKLLTKDWQTKYCSKECTGIAHRTRERRLTCLTCGKPLTRNQLKNKNRYCSTSCAAKGSAFKEEIRKRKSNNLMQFVARFTELYGDKYKYVCGYTGSDNAFIAKCVVCGNECEINAQCIRRGRIVGCMACEQKEREAKAKKERAEAKAERERINAEKSARKEAERIRRMTRECVQCGEEFVANHGASVCCSEVCKKRRANHAKELSRRNRLRENGIVDKNVTLERLIKRDKNTCHICGGKCDNHDYHIRQDGVFIVGDGYPSIDHVMAVSNGGTHTWGNVKLAHQGCNTRKSNKVCYQTKEGQMVLAI